MSLIGSISMKYPLVSYINSFLLIFLDIQSGSNNFIECANVVEKQRELTELILSKVSTIKYFVEARKSNQVILQNSTEYTRTSVFIQTMHKSFEHSTYIPTYSFKNVVLWHVFC